MISDWIVQSLENSILTIYNKGGAADRRLAQWIILYKEITATWVGAVIFFVLFTATMTAVISSAN